MILHLKFQNHFNDKSTALYLHGDLYVAVEFMREMEYGM